MENRKQKLMDQIHEIDEALNKVLPVQREMHALFVLNAPGIPDWVKRETKKTDVQIELMKNARDLLQDMLFAEYKTIILCDWKEP